VAVRWLGRKTKKTLKVAVIAATMPKPTTTAGRAVRSVSASGVRVAAPRRWTVRKPGVSSIRSRM
jgi:hypothetical protein